MLQVFKVALVGALALGACALPSLAREEGRFLTARDLVALRDIDGLHVSPDGAWIAFLEREADPEANAYHQTWMLVPRAGGAPRVLGDGGAIFQLTHPDGRINGHIEAPYARWSPDSQAFYVLRKENGVAQVWRRRLNADASEQVSFSEGSVRSFELTPDGERLLVEVGPAPSATEAALLREGRSGFLFDERFWPTYAVEPQYPRTAPPRVLRSVALASARSSRSSVVARDTAQARLASAEDTALFAQLSALTDREAIARDGRLARVDAERLRVGRSADDAGSADLDLRCDGAPCSEVRGLWWRDDGELIFARVAPGRALELRSWGEADGLGETRLVATLPNLSLRRFHWDCASAEADLICMMEAPDQPRRLVAIDLASGALRVIYDPNSGFARFDLGAPPRRVAVRAPGDVDTDAYLVLPPAARRGRGRLPLVIVTYSCGGFLRGGVGDEYPIYPFAAEGFAVACLNVPQMDARTGGRGEGDPEKRRAQAAIDALVAQLAAEGVIDPDRVGLTGLSYGAETVTYALFNMPRLRAAIASGSEIGPSSTFLYSERGRSGSLAAWGLDRWESERWETLSITHNTARVRAPLLVNVADRELLSVLHPYVALQQAGRAVEMHVFPDEYHIKWQPAHRLAIYERNIDWMNFWLRDVERVRPGAEDQYERWRALRALERAMVRQ